MVEALRRDYANSSAMIFGTPPSFDDILASVTAIDAAVNFVAKGRWNWIIDLASFDVVGHGQLAIFRSHNEVNSR